MILNTIHRPAHRAIAHGVSRLAVSAAGAALVLAAPLVFIGLVIYRIGGRLYCPFARPAAAALTWLRECLAGAALILIWPFVFTAWTLYCAFARMFPSRPDDSEAMP